MSTQETVPLDPEPDGAIGRANADAEESGIRGVGKHRSRAPGQGEPVEPGEAEEDVVELDKEEAEDQAPAAAPPTPTTAANAKKAFGIKRSNPTVKKGVKTTSSQVALVSHAFL